MFAQFLTKLACFALLLNDGVFAKKYKKKPKYVEDEYMYEDEPANDGYGFMRDQFLAFVFISFAIWIGICVIRRTVCYVCQNINFETLGFIIALFVSIQCYTSNQVLFDEVHDLLRTLAAARGMTEWMAICTQLSLKIFEMACFGFKDISVWFTTALGLWNYTVATNEATTATAK